MAYDAFISYSHAGDRALAVALQSGLQRFAKPWRKRRALAVFRDDASLSANPGLWTSITAAMDASRYLVLLASPEAAQSPWVAKEVEYWRATKPAGTILPVVTAGEWRWDAEGNGFDPSSTAVPPSVVDAFTEEPRHVDLRWARTEEHLNLRRATFRSAIAELAAPLHGRPKEDMEGEDVRQFRRTRQIVAATITVLVLLVVAASTGALVAVRYAAEANDQAAIAVSRQLSAQSRLDLDSSTDRALLLATEARTAAPTAEARTALALALQRTTGDDYVLRPGAQQYAVAISPDGTTLASGGPDGTVALTVLATGAALRQLPAAGGGPPHDLAFSPDGKQLAVLTTGVGARLWDVASGVADGDPVADAGDHVTFDPRSGALVITGGTGTGARRYDPVRHTPLPWPPNPHKGQVTAVVVSSQGVLATGSDDKTVALTFADGAQRVLTGFGAAVTAMAFSPDGSTLVVGSLNEAQIWDVATQQKRGAVSGGKGIVLAVAVSRDGNVLATAGLDRVVRLWNITSRVALRTLPGHVNLVFDAAYGPDGLLATTGWDGTVRVWDTTDVLPVFGPTMALAGGAWSPDGRKFAAGAVDGPVRIFDTAARREAGTLVGHTTPVRAVAWSPDGTLIASAAGTAAPSSPDADVRLWDAVTGRQRASLPHAQGAAQIAFSPDGRLLATVGSDAHLRIWDVATGKQRGADLVPPSSVPSLVGGLAFLDDDHVVTAVAYVAKWDLKAGTSVPVGTDGFAGLPGGVFAAAATPDGTTLALGSTDGQVALWDVRADRMRAAPFVAHEQIVEDLAFSPDGTTLASVGIDGNLAFWDAATGKAVGAPLSLTGLILSDVAFRPDGTQIATVSSDGGIRLGPSYLWDADAGRQRDRVCRIVGRNLTRAEWDQFLSPEEYRRTCAAQPDGGP